MSNPFKFTGEIYDDESGLIYLRARYYDHTIGRVITEDNYEGQLDNPLTLNLYTFVYNNSLKYSDPSGHDAYTFYGMKDGENNGFKDRAEAEATWWENNNDTPVHLIVINTEQEFINAWKNMGEN